MGVLGLRAVGPVCVVNRNVLVCVALCGHVRRLDTFYKEALRKILSLGCFEAAAGRSLGCLGPGWGPCTVVSTIIY